MSPALADLTQSEKLAAVADELGVSVSVAARTQFYSIVHVLPWEPDPLSVEPQVPVTVDDIKAEIEAEDVVLSVQKSPRDASRLLALMKESAP